MADYLLYHSRRDVYYWPVCGPVDWLPTSLQREVTRNRGVDTINYQLIPGILNNQLSLTSVVKDSHIHDGVLGPPRTPSVMSCRGHSQNARTMNKLRRRTSMTKTILTLTCLTIVGLSLVACGWNPKVTAVPITAPWDKMNLPIKQDAIVWGSTATEFKAVHKDDRKTVMGKYVEALKAQGWALTNFDDKHEHS